MNWTCQQIEELLSEYVDHALGYQTLDSQQRAAFAAHAQSCPRCRPLVARVAGTAALLRRLEPLEPPERLVRRILEQTVVAEATRGWRVGLRRLPDWLRSVLIPVLQPRFAMGAVTTFVAVLMLSQALGVSLDDVKQVKLADFHPVNLYRAADRRAHLLYARGVKFVNDLRVIQEIQSRVQPVAQPEPAQPPEKAPADKQSEGQNPKDQSHADKSNRNRTLFTYTLASAGLTPATRSSR